MNYPLLSLCFILFFKTNYGTPVISIFGNTSSTRMGRIINGDLVDEYVNRFIVRLHINQSWLACSGTVLTPRLILTAAHCIVRREGSPRPTIVRVGYGRSYTLHRILEYHPHPEYNRRNQRPDLAILGLENPIANAKSVKLMSKMSGTLEPGSQVVAYGSEDGNTDLSGLSQLSRVDLQVLPPSQCDKLFPSKGHLICTNPSPRNTCDGDSGGPLMWQGFQIGVLFGRSSSQSCSSAKAFTNVTFYWDWIYENVRNLERQGIK